MAKSKIPDPLKRRHLVEQELESSQSQAIAELYLQDGRVQEAIDFLAMADSEEPLQALAEEAVAKGDAFLLKQLGVALKRDFDAATWSTLAEAAEASGKLEYAETARRQARVSEV